VGELRRRAKGVIAPSGITADPLFAVHFMYDSITAVSEAWGDIPLSDWQLACLIFCGLNTLVGYGALAEAMARWQAAQVSALITLTPLFTLLFSDLLSMAWPDVFARPMLNLIGYLGAFVVVAGAMYSAIGHRLWGRWRKREAVVPLPRSGE
jgi:drug/metabolite transporter (DMT)-like permease